MDHREHAITEGGLEVGGIILAYEYNVQGMLPRALKGRLQSLHVTLRLAACGELQTQLRPARVERYSDGAPGLAHFGHVPYRTTWVRNTEFLAATLVILVNI